MFLVHIVSNFKENAALLLCYCILFFYIVSCNNIAKKKESINSFKTSTVLKINDIPVSIEEYNIVLEEEKAMTYNYFFQKYGAEKNNQFWKSSYGKESPIDYIKNKTNSRFRRLKVIQQYAAKMGIVKPFVFKKFLNDWQEENKKRKLKHDAGGIVYGPVETSMQNYYFYLQTNLEIRLKDKLDETYFNPKKNDLEAYYEVIKSKKFTFIDTISISYLSFPYKNSNQRKKSIRKAKEAYGDALKLNSIKPLKGKYPSAIYQQKVFYDNVKLHGEENEDRILKNYASTLIFGHIKLLDTKININSSVYIISLLKPIQKKFRPFENVIDEVLFFYKKNEYEKLMKLLNTSASLEINQEVYNRIDTLLI